MQLGREYPFDEIPVGKCLIHQNLAQRLKAEKGDIIFL